MLNRVTKAKRQRSYSLVELLVVIAVISIIGVASVPNIFNRSDRLQLDFSANQLRQMIIDAQTRSKAPDKTDSASGAQIYQVAVGKFGACTSNCGTSLLAGQPSTNTIKLERGLAQCDTGDTQGGFSTLKNLTLPRGIYISNFYPSVQVASDDQAVIRFTVGQEGFVCGSYSNPLIKSTQINSSVWSGANGVGSTTARYLVVTLSSQRVSEKRFVTVDRATGEVAVARANPQSYFTPVADTLAPRWTDTDPTKFTLSITCGPNISTVLVSFPRAQDRVSDPASAGDPNLLVTYDITWNNGSGDRPLSLGHFEDLSHTSVTYRAETKLFTFSNQPTSITITAAATDAFGHIQPAYVAADPLNSTNQMARVFQPSCGHQVQGDPAGETLSCNPITQNTDADNWWARLRRRIITPAVAQVGPMPSLSCALAT